MQLLTVAAPVVYSLLFVLPPLLRIALELLNRL